MVPTHGHEDNRCRKLTSGLPAGPSKQWIEPMSRRGATKRSAFCRLVVRNVRFYEELVCQGLSTQGGT